MMRFQHAGLRVRNLDRSLQFYTGPLGFRVKSRGDTRSWGGGIWVLLEDPRSHRVVELNWYPRTSLFGGRFSVGGGIDHLDFTLGVAPPEALGRLYRRLLQAGGRPTGYEPATTAGWMASVRDPDGIWITIGRRPTVRERRAIAASVRRSGPRRRRPS
ncbi:MAG TPA: VOC family protein [Thermoplasmata archaeon]|nr:VOC family protein [Thermoplasmata archaeon]